MKGKSRAAAAKGRVDTRRGTLTERLAAARANLDRAAVPSAEETQRVLRARAEALAKVREPEAGGVETIEVVQFSVAGESYGIESRHVREVCLLRNLTPLPCTPPFVRGIVNLRGAMLSVVDLEILFELPRRKLTDRDKVIVLAAGDMCFGILVDRVDGVRRILAASLQPPMPTLTGVCADYLRGVTPERTVVLDGERLLTDDGIVVQQLVAG